MTFYEEEIDVPQDPTRDGYTFIGWDKDFSEIISDLEITNLYRKKTLLMLNIMISMVMLLKKKMLIMKVKKFFQILKLQLFLDMNLINGKRQLLRQMILNLELFILK